MLGVRERSAARIAGGRDPLGPLGERAAGRFLRRAGYRVLGRNVRVRAGEADLVCEAPDRRTVVIVEVKSRRRGAGSHPASESIAPEASITAHKKRKLVAVTRSLVRLNRWEDRPVRIDVVAVEWPVRGRRRPTIRHFVGAVGLESR